MNREADGPVHGYRELALYIGLAAPAVIGTAFLVHAGIMASPLRHASKPVQLIVPQLAGYAAAVGVLAGLAKSRGEDWLRGLHWHIPEGSAFQCVALGAAVAVSNVLIGSLLKTPLTDNPMQQLMLEDPVSMTLAAVTMAPLCEEVFFRGVLQPVLVRDTGVFGIVLAALPFALLHGPEYAWSWNHILLIAAAGASFGLIRHRMRSTGAAALAHATYNGLLLLFYLFGRILV